VEFIADGELYLDRDAKLPMYRVEIRGDEVYLHVPQLVREPLDIDLDPPTDEETAVSTPELAPNEFLLEQLAVGEIKLVHVDGEPVAVANVEENYFATHNLCTHVGGPLHEGHLNGYDIICPWHDSCFDMRNGKATCGPGDGRCTAVSYSS
jgi:nitrite reductase/ring-hydroxylating ferredoxin subunit